MRPAALSLKGLAAAGHVPEGFMTHSDSKLKRKTIERFTVRSYPTGVVYEVECVLPELEVKTPYGPKVITKHPEFRVVDSMRPVNWNPVDDSLTLVGSGETLIRI